MGKRLPLSKLCQVCLKDQSWAHCSLLYINNVSDVVSSDTHLNIFADDMAIYRVIKSIEDYDTLQEDINSVAAFMSDKQLHLNTSKCKLSDVNIKQEK